MSLLWKCTTKTKAEDYFSYAYNKTVKIESDFINEKHLQKI